MSPRWVKAVTLGERRKIDGREPGVDVARGGERVLAGRREPQAPAETVEHGRAERLLQLLDLLGDTRPRHEQPPPGLCHGSPCGDRFQHLKLAKGQVGHVHKYFFR